MEFCVTKQDGVPELQDGLQRLSLNNPSGVWSVKYPCLPNITYRDGCIGLTRCMKSTYYFGYR